ncbi:MAG: AraC family transcriptional regulator [Myxococcales bacterium]|nr:AraC family transcriptional regulator [Myxococcales bacterium]MCB9550100.1 AraC family transcriptional regulator [Myxococcales bacterium]
MDAPPPLVARFRRVLAHIEDHPDGALDLDALSGVAAYSKYHFHRQFQAFFGLSLHRYVQGQRLRRAGEQLALQPKLRVLDAALAAGYESHEAFTRAFRQATGRTPSAFRRQPQWPAWHALWRPLRDLRRTHMQATPRLDDVRVVDFPATPLAIAEHHGDPARLFETIQRLIAWRRANGLPPSVAATFNIAWGNPETPTPETFRFDVAVATPGPVAPNPQGVVAGALPACRCAVLRHHGTEDTLGSTIAFLYRDWLAASDEEPADLPLFFQRVSFPPAVSHHEAITDIFLPLRDGHGG